MPELMAARFVYTLCLMASTLGAAEMRVLSLPVLFLHGARGSRSMRPKALWNRRGTLGFLWLTLLPLAQLQQMGTFWPKAPSLRVRTVIVSIPLIPWLAPAGPCGYRESLISADMLP